MRELLVIAACVAVALGIVWAVTSSPTVWSLFDAQEANRLRTAASAKREREKEEAFWEAHPEFLRAADLYESVGQPKEDSETLTSK